MMNIHELAIFSQGACNLGALVRSWAEVVKVLQEEAQAKGFGTDWVNKHPVNVLFAEQVYHLTGYGSRYSESYTECTTKAAARPPAQQGAAGPAPMTPVLIAD